ncbi:LOG family protein [Dermacoccus barathri]|uniref:LOG family protein n=1 Tax=Dermacoccus barathri TaxID=322601 RepID=A0ABN2C5V0_9MICO
MLREIHSAAELDEALDGSVSLDGFRLQNVDLSGSAGTRLREAADRFDGLVVLGGQVPGDLAMDLTRRGAIIFPADPGAPVDAYRHALYSPTELYDGLEPSGYEATPDARAYAWFGECAARHDAYATALRALHDDSMRDALQEALDGRRTVGIMGGHAMSRDEAAFLEIAHLARRLAEAGLVVLTGGGPGAMEAANLGGADRTGRLDEALDVVAQVPSFRPDIGAWASAGFRAKELLGSGDDLRSVGIPTWLYGHEPPNVFGDAIAKYFSNALREDDLLAGSNDAVVVLEGAAGTVQEIFQSVTPLYYAPDDAPLPDLVLVGQRQWTEMVPVWPALTALSEGKRFAEHLHLVETPGEALDIVLARA